MLLLWEQLKDKDEYKHPRKVMQRQTTDFTFEDPLEQR